MKMTKDGHVCDAERSQLKALTAAGWRPMGAPAPKAPEPEKEAEAPQGRPQGRETTRRGRRS